MKVSIIIPCFNAEQKISKCLTSLEKINFDEEDYEVIFVDDKSTDFTYKLLQNKCKEKKTWKLHQTKVNSGSPSVPRNYGLSLSMSDYVFFLDCDDEIYPDTIQIHYDMAVKEDADIVRAKLHVNNGVAISEANKIELWNPHWSNFEKITNILRYQSLTPTALFKRSFLYLNQIKFDSSMKMGEDTCFVSEALCKSNSVIYIDHVAFIYNRLPSVVDSTTQSFGDKELNDQLKMWNKLESIYLEKEIDYYKIRFHVNFKYVLSLLIHKNRGDITSDTYDSLNKLLVGLSNRIDLTSYSDRYIEIYKSILSGNCAEFRQKIKPRLLIAGHDLKFISSSYHELEKYFEIKIDEWQGHNQHDEEKSSNLLDWSEYIWCEWLLGNAVWYSKRKKSNQRLLIRMHRFEVGLNFGSDLKIENVDAVITVTPLFFERLLEKFPNIPRSKVRLVPVGYTLEKYDKNFSSEKLFTLGLIGILPSGKGLDKALMILKDLKKIDSRFKLEIFGKNPDELHWIKSDKKEMDFFENCKKFIVDNGIADSVMFNGHADISKEISNKKIGYILSVSKQVRELPGFEAFHVAVGDGFAAGSISLILHYLGSEYVWPSENIFYSIENIVEKIIFYTNNIDEYKRNAENGRLFLQKRYSENRFATIVKDIFKQSAT